MLPPRRAILSIGSEQLCRSVRSRPVLSLLLPSRPPPPWIIATSVTALGPHYYLCPRARPARKPAASPPRRAEWRPIHRLESTSPPALPLAAPLSDSMCTHGGVKPPQPEDGPARLTIEATQRPPREYATSTRSVTRRKPVPRLSVDSEQHTLLGMADWYRHRLRLSGRPESASRSEIPPWPMPGGKPGFFSLYARLEHAPQTIPLVYHHPRATKSRRMVIRFPQKEQPKYRTRTWSSTTVHSESDRRTRPQRLRDSVTRF